MNKIEMKQHGQQSCVVNWGKAWTDHRREKRQAIKTDGFLLEADYRLEAQGEPYKSLLIRAEQFIYDLMSLGH